MRRRLIRRWRSKSLFSLPLYPARNSLRDRYVAEADRVIADYREASESTPVYSRDWRRAQAALNSAMALSRRKTRRSAGKYQLVDGHLQLLKAGNLKEARADFEEARKLLPHSPDPHLGLALIQMSDGDLDKAEEELNEAKRNGFRPGRREQKRSGQRIPGARGEVACGGETRARYRPDAGCAEACRQRSGACAGALQFRGAIAEWSATGGEGFARTG